MNSSLSAKRTNIERSHLFALGFPNMLKNAQYMPQNVLPLLGRVRALSSPWPGCMQPIAMGLEASPGPPATEVFHHLQHSSTAEVLHHLQSRCWARTAPAAPCPPREGHCTFPVLSSTLLQASRHQEFGSARHEHPAHPVWSKARAFLRRFPMSQM